MPDVAVNKQARHRYHLLDKWEAGLVLTGTEVKSLRGGKATIKDGKVKVEIALARGKDKGDKRRTIADREAKRQIDRAVKARR